MAQYIDKSALVAEIESLENIYKKCPTRNSYEEGLIDGRLIGYKDALYIINTLEVKEVDLMEEIDVYFQKNKNGYNGLLICKKEDFSVIASHFFELGMAVNNKAQKGE